jgi:hypothetical protein
MIYDFVLASEIKISLNEAREISPFNGTALVPKPRLSIAGSINEGETEDTPRGTALFGMLPKSQEWSGSACEASAKGKQKRATHSWIALFISTVMNCYFSSSFRRSRIARSNDCISRPACDQFQDCRAFRTFS